MKRKNLTLCALTMAIAGAISSPAYASDPLENADKVTVHHLYRKNLKENRFTDRVGEALALTRSDANGQFVYRGTPFWLSQKQLVVNGKKMVPVYSLRWGHRQRLAIGFEEAEEFEATSKYRRITHKGGILGYALTERHENTARLWQLYRVSADEFFSTVDIQLVSKQGDNPDGYRPFGSRVVYAFIHGPKKF
jgi:hypothetical protein